MYRISIEQADLEAIHSSPAVLELAGKPRYDVYRVPETSEQQWVEWLDADFDNKEHLGKTALLIEAICEEDGIMGEDREIAVLTGAVHDACESRIGDKNIHLKTKADDEEEISTTLQLVHDGHLNVPLEKIALVIETMADKNRKPPQTARGEAFDMGELFGYVLSGVTAWNSAEARLTGMSALQAYRLRLLSMSVLAGQLQSILDYVDRGKKSPHILLEGIAADLDAIFAFGHEPRTQAEHAVVCHEKGFGHKAEQLTASFYAVHEAWKQYKQDRLPTIT